MGYPGGCVFNSLLNIDHYCQLRERICAQMTLAAPTSFVRVCRGGHVRRLYFLPAAYVFRFEQRSLPDPWARRTPTSLVFTKQDSAVCRGCGGVAVFLLS